jgi:hypothetical protein
MQHTSHRLFHIAMVMQNLEMLCHASSVLETAVYALDIMTLMPQTLIC